MIRRHQPQRILPRDKDTSVPLEVIKGDELPSRWRQFVGRGATLGSADERQASTDDFDEPNAEGGLSSAAARSRDGREGLVDGRRSIREVNLAGGPSACAY